MNASNVRDMDRLSDLLADEASAALDASDGVELRALLERHPVAHRDEFMQAAALAQVAFLRRARRAAGPRSAAGAMPAGLKERVVSQGQAAAVRRRTVTSRPVPAPTLKSPAPQRPAGAPAPATRRPGALPYLGWALAAMLAVALVVPRVQQPTAPAGAEQDSVAARARLLSEAKDVVTLPWAPPEAAGYQGVKGDVVWSPSRQQGYLRLASMPVNDPARSQYQLWIVDPERDSHPVDGGVFNVGRTGEVVIPIQAKLNIRAPKAFAITAEKPGGVVVSAGPLLVVAST